MLTFQIANFGFLNSFLLTHITLPRTYVVVYDVNNSSVGSVFSSDKLDTSAAQVRASLTSQAKKSILVKTNDQIVPAMVCSIPVSHGSFSQRPRTALANTNH